ncbi:homeobox-leucine zipper protein HAT14-like [Ananas comosus]|uniref:Homeobox-leucine zipper protein HAT14-like n=1 Tax=Ananas comosus TaxID=4615 RepID=A0A6P5ECZ4_ANACO|nr:homeobox-leucine zipper protein HAT14-like [Ananas comosus]
MEHERDFTMTILCLGLGGQDGESRKPKRRREVDPRPPVKFDVLFPSQSNQNNKDMINESVGNENYASLCKSRSRSINNGVESGGEDGKGCTRKKLRLTKDQLALLESSFVQHNTLNSSMKQELAHKLNLSPRQVEVWFQNKRARSKLKQNEVNYEMLKKCCERLSEENQKLKEKLEELRLMRLKLPFYVQQYQNEHTLIMCPSCKLKGEDDALASVKISQ